LTGRENIYLNGSVLGMSRKEVAARFDEIVSFSGLERFLETPLKRYSAGMRLRLAFAVAAHLESEIVVVDEILAAGDAEFQRKCLGRMSELEHYGRTIVFVSHDLGAVTRLCSRVVWLDGGSVVEDGRPEVVTRAYLQSGAEAAKVEFDLDPRQPVQLRAVAITDADGVAVTSPRRDQDLFIRFSIVVRERTPGVDVALDLVNQDGVHVVLDALSDAAREEDQVAEEGDYEVVAVVPPVLAAGDYVLQAWIGTPHETFLEDEVLAFRADPRPGERALELARSRAAAPAIPWSVVRETPTPSGPS
jgi:ABC-type multidrug transport system ATPase subunit